jgi:hypothetical protein
MRAQRWVNASGGKPWRQMERRIAETAGGFREEVKALKRPRMAERSRGDGEKAVYLRRELVSG